jgi:F0F1-type ATP synthase alpha subunit
MVTALGVMPASDAFCSSLMVPDSWPAPALLQAGELVCFDSGVKGMALNLQADHVGIVVFGADTSIHQGDLVYRTGQIVNVPIGPGTLGRVLDALGQPIDGKGPMNHVRSSLVEVKAPGACGAPAWYLLAPVNAQDCP